VGVTDHQAIITRFVEANTRNARLHVVPIGLDADYTFLADLALRSGGSFTPLDPADGRLALRLERLYDLVGHSLVRDVEATLAGIDAVDVRPRVLPDLAEDRCLRVLFRANWTGADDLTLRVAGRDADGPVSLEFSFPRPAVLERPAVSALWGRAQVDDLLSLERMGAASRSAVVENATAFRQLSPYTSWVIVDSAQSALAQDAAGAASGTRYASGSGASGPGQGTTQTPGLGAPVLAAAVLLVAWAARRRQR
jgi:hypothetical protein